MVPTLPRGNPCWDAPASYSPVAAIVHANAGHGTLEHPDARSHAGAWERERRAIPGLVETLSLMHMGRNPALLPEIVPVVPKEAHATLQIAL